MYAAPSTPARAAAALGAVSSESGLPTAENDLVRHSRDWSKALREHHPEALALAYGHVGDGNVRLNVIPPIAASAETMARLFHGAEEAIFNMVDHLHDSISAEHGIGRVKQKAFVERTDKVALDLALILMRSFDPRGLLSASRILPGPADSEN
jgi:FAD/FMN-containing dehydrogenase